MTEQATRLATKEGEEFPAGWNDTECSYWKARGGNTNGQWWIYLPGVGAGRLPNHTITEHDDGTITVSPSILLGNVKRTRHGFLERGVWREC